MEYKIEIACNKLNSLGEGPIWDSVKKTICWADISNGEIHELDPKSKSHTIIQVNEMVGSFAVCKNGDFVAALEHGFSFVDRTTGAKIIIRDPEGKIILMCKGADSIILPRVVFKTPREQEQKV